MRKRIESPVEVALAAFSRNVKFRMLAVGFGDNYSELHRNVMKRAKITVSQKTISNLSAVRHSATIGTLDAVAVAVDTPLWVLFIPGLEESDLQSPGKEKLVALVEHYLACDAEGRSHVENMASAFAAKIQQKDKAK